MIEISSDEKGWQERVKAIKDKVHTSSKGKSKTKDAGASKKRKTGGKKKKERDDDSDEGAVTVDGPQRIRECTSA